jgi:hypothetical protein
MNVYLLGKIQAYDSAVDLHAKFFSEDCCLGRAHSEEMGPKRKYWIRGQLMKT